MMRARILLLCIVLVLFVPSAFAGEPAPEPVVYGKALSESEVTPISDLLANPAEFVGKTVKVAGNILGVCEMAGCWIEIASGEESETIRFKVNDGDIVFPVEVKGQAVVAEGTFEKIELDLDQTREMKQHECEEKGEDFDLSTVTEGAVIYRLAGLGAVVR